MITPFKQDLASKGAGTLPQTFMAAVDPNGTYRTESSKAAHSTTRSCRNEAQARASQGTQMYRVVPRTKNGLQSQIPQNAAGYRTKSPSASFVSLPFDRT